MGTERLCVADQERVVAVVVVVNGRAVGLNVVRRPTEMTAICHP